jgi:hypothetical protein
VGVDRLVPAMAIAGGEDGGVGKHQGVLAHLCWLGIGWGQLAVAARQELAVGGGEE